MNIRLVHFSVVGPGREATVAFGERLTVVYGASDTGKSFICDGIDYMLGGSELKSIPELDGFSTCLLGCEVAGERWTLARDIHGGDFRLHQEDVRSLPESPPARTLAARHVGSSESLSLFLLDAIGLAGASVRQNASGRRRSLSMRDVVRLCVVDETEMQAEVSPVVTGQHVSGTAEKAVFRLLVEGDALAADEDPQPLDRRVAAGQRALVERLISDAEEALRSAPPRDKVQAQLERVTAALSERLAAAASLVAERDQQMAQRRAVERAVAEAQDRLTEVGELEARFGLLMTQYDTDLARLQMVAEAGDLLGYLTTGVCVFCGAEVADQHPRAPHVVGDVTEFGTALGAEILKIGSLREDLGSTLTDVRAESASVSERLSNFERTLVDLQARISELDRLLEPGASELSELASARSTLEGWVSSYEQLDRLHAILAEFSTVAVRRPPEAPSTRALADFSRTVESLLSAWGVPDATPVDFDANTYELIVGGQPRRNRGKGMRAVAHAAFTVALAEYCAARGLPHPGFIVLDSPLVTYRGPDSTPTSDDVADEAVSLSVAASFFRYLDESFPGQAVVFENTDPPPLSDEARVVHFTKREFGRYGFIG